MKKKPWLMALIYCFIAISSFSQDDKTAIKAAIEKETTAYFGVDSTAWKSFWLNASYTYWSYSDSSGGSFVEGTNNLFKSFKGYFKTAKPANSRIERNWIEIRVYGSGAYAHFTQKIIDGADISTTAEVRVLEKENGKWKIVCMIANAMYPPKK